MPDHSDHVETALKYEVSGKNLDVWLEPQERLRVSSGGHGVIRLQVTRNGRFGRASLVRYGFVQPMEPPTPPAVTEGESNGRLRLTAAFAGATVVLTAAGGGGVVVRVEDESGSHFAESLPIRPMADGFAASFLLEGGERILGAGDGPRGRLDHRGHIVHMWVRNVVSYIPIPFMMSTKGYALLANTTWRHLWDIGKSDPSEMRIDATGAPMDLFVMVSAQGFPGLIDSYTNLTGRPILPPKWALGPWFICRLSADDREVMDDARLFREMGIPCDVLGLEPGWMKQFYDFSTRKGWNTDKFYLPHWDMTGPDTLISSVKRMGYHFELWLCQDYDLSVEAERQVRARSGGSPALGYADPLAPAGGDTGELTATAADADADADAEIDEAEYAARSKNPLVPVPGDDHGLGPIRSDRLTVEGEPWFRHLEAFVDQGADFFKQDGASQVNEHPDRLSGNGMTDAEMHNLYPMLYSQQMYEGFRARTGRRPLVFTCAGYAGLQRYSSTWTGDTGGGLGTVGANLNLGLCGQGLTTCDTEVYTPEGLHLGFMHPIAQVNSWAYWKHPWYQTHEQQAVYRAYARLRSRLIPYLYTYSWGSARTGLPIMRAMPLEDPMDDASYACLSQFFLGKELLVGALTSTLHVPAGLWHNFWTDEVHALDAAGAISPEVPAGWGGPVLARSGAIIPLGEVMDYVGQRPESELSLEVYATANGEFILYEDDGVTFAHEEGDFATTHFRLTVAESTPPTPVARPRVALTIGVREGEYATKPPERRYTVRFHLGRGAASPRSASVDGASASFTFCPETGVAEVAGVQESRSVVTVEIL